MSHRHESATLGFDCILDYMQEWKSFIRGRQERTYTYTDSDGQKCYVPVERIHSLSQLHKGDHIAIERLYGLYWHHAIVEHVETEKGIINVIEYSSYVEELLQDISCSRSPGKAKVVRGKYRLEGVLYLIKHKKCLPADEVIVRARSRLGETKYNLFKSNCEHLAMWCKTGISSSEQAKIIEELMLTIDDVKKALSLAMAMGATQQIASKAGEEMVKTTVREMIKEVVSQTVSKGGQQMMKIGTQTAAELVVSQTVSNGGQQMMIIGTQTAAELVVSQTVSNGGQQMMKIGTQTAAKQVFSQTVSNGGQQLMKIGTQTATKQVVCQTVSNGGKQIIKIGTQTAAEQVVSQTVSNGGQQMMKISTQTAAKQVVSQTVSNGGQQMMKISTQTAAKQVVSQTASKGGQEMLKSGTRETTKEFFTHTATKAGEEIVTKGTRETTREVITQTSTNTGTSAGESLMGGAACAVLFEAGFAAYDISCAKADLKAGKISKKEFFDAVDKRIVGGVGSVAGSTTGAAVGQFLIPVPVLGGIVGSMVGGLIGRISGNALWKVAQ